MITPSTADDADPSKTLMTGAQLDALMTGNTV